MRKKGKKSEDPSSWTSTKTIHYNEQLINVTKVICKVNTRQSLSTFLLCFWSNFLILGYRVSQGSSIWLVRSGHSKYWNTGISSSEKCSQKVINPKGRKMWLKDEAGRTEKRGPEFVSRCIGWTLEHVFSDMIDLGRGPRGVHKLRQCFGFPQKKESISTISVHWHVINRIFTAPFSAAYQLACWLLL